MAANVTFSAVATDLIEGLWRENRIKVWSLIITVFGDCIVPRGGQVSLSSLQVLTDSIGVEGNALRTALSRLAKDGWLLRDRHGRSSSYKLAQAGDQLFENASQRIYARGPRDWDGQFEFVVQTDATQAEKARQKRKLLNDGFGSLGNGVFIKPANHSGKTQLMENAFSFLARPADDHSPSSITANAWPFEELDKAYADLIARFSNVSMQSADISSEPNLEAVVLRLLLVHEWRRILLKDVDLPLECRPGGWQGEEARQFVYETYHNLLAPSEAFLDRLEREPGKTLPKADAELKMRFA